MVANASKASTHLYLITTSATIQAYPLNRLGLPSNKADWELSGGLSFPRYLALDGSGYLYVSDVSVNQVKVYAPGASGNDNPVRTITLPAPGQPEELAVSKAGYVFLTYYDDLQVLVYAPGAHDSGSKPADPVLMFSPGLNYIGSVVVDSAGRLYLASINGPIYVYNDLASELETHNFIMPDRIITAEAGESGPYSPMTVDTATSSVYMQVVLDDQPYRWQANDWAERSIESTSPDRTSATRYGSGSGGLSYSFAMTANVNYVTFACYYCLATVVFRNETGRQAKAIETLPASYDVLLWP